MHCKCNATCRPTASGACPHPPTCPRRPAGRSGGVAAVPPPAGHRPLLHLRHRQQAAAGGRAAALHRGAARLAWLGAAYTAAVWIHAQLALHAQHPGLPKLLRCLPPAAPRHALSPTPAPKHAHPLHPQEGLVTYEYIDNFISAAQQLSASNNHRCVVLPCSAAAATARWLLGGSQSGALLGIAAALHAGTAQNIASGSCTASASVTTATATAGWVRPRAQPRACSLGQHGSGTRYKAHPVASCHRPAAAAHAPLPPSPLAAPTCPCPQPSSIRTSSWC